MKYISWLWVLIFIGSVGDIGAVTYFVSNTGNDANPGTSTLPLKTITRSVAVAKAGDEVRIRPGIYKEKVLISGKNGSPSAPIVFVGESSDPNNYPILDGGDVGYASSTDAPVFTVRNSAWLVFERLKLINSSESSMLVDASHYITFRRNIVDYHTYGLLLRNKSSHVLVEYNDFYQSYSDNLTWSDLKGSKWEGGALTSFGGAGMNVIRYNYFHDSFNAIFLGNDDGGRRGDYYDANVWIYRNRFEDIVDDPYEPESYAFNNHFFQNTLINTHRLISLALQGPGTGPIYVYNNLMQMTRDITGDVPSGTINSPFKLELDLNIYPKGVFAFNNSIDMDYPGTNSYGAETENTIKFYTQKNNIFKILKNVLSASSVTLSNALLTNDMANKSFGPSETNGYPNTDPGFVNLSNEDLRLGPNSPAIGKSKEVSGLIGFASQPVIVTGSDLGAFEYGESNFRQSPLPVYVIPPGGEDISFPANVAWPADIRGGINPISGPKWMAVNNPVSPTGVIVKMGDTNGSGTIDLVDFGNWKKEYLVQVATKTADFNKDAKVDLVDFGIWKNSYLGN